MSLVGDIILELRSRIPDAPAVANPPNILSVTTGFDARAGFIPGSTHQVAATAANHWGETVMGPTSPVTVTLGPNDNAIFVTVAAAPPPFYETVQLYETGSPGYVMLDQWTFPIPAGQGVFTVMPLGVPNHTGGPPSRPTAFNPDTDGNFIGGYMAFRLLNRALSEMVKIAGGIVDVTGVRTTVNQSMYRLDSPFYTFVNAWYDGYPMDVVPRSMMYLRNSAAGFSGILSYEQDGPQQVIQVWPQSNRTGGSTVLAADLDEEGNSFAVTDSSGFLSIGLARIDDEVVVFSTAGKNQFSGVTRGMGGTEIAYHVAGAPVTELNLRMSGYRMARTYNVGDSVLTLMVPQSWETPLVLHMLSQVRSMEQDDQTAQKLLSDFQAQAEKIAKGSRLGRLKPRQIPIWGQNVSDSRNVNGVGFGWLIN